MATPAAAFRRTPPGSLSGLPPRFWLLTALTGIAAGIGAIVIMAILRTVQHLAFSYHAGEYSAAAARHGDLRRMAVLVCGGIIAGLGGWVLRRKFGGSGGEPTRAVWSGSGELSLRLVYVSLSGGGRGQIAAALTNVISDHRVSVHSAGTAAHGQIDPGVGSVIDELGIDAADAFARPVAPEVMGVADVSVTMGHSVGVLEMPPEIRHVDWRVGDPIGAPIEEIRRVCADIEYRVRGLLGDLRVPLSSAGGITVGA